MFKNNPKKLFTRFSTLFVLLAIWLLVGCGTIQTPTQQDSPSIQSGNSTGDKNQINNQKSDQNNVSDESFTGINHTPYPLEAADGFEISVFADNLPGARDLSGFDKMGNLWLSRTRPGVITLLTIGESGQVINQADVFKNLNLPHGLAIDPDNGLTFFYATADGVYRAQLYTDASPEKITALPHAKDDRHYTRSLHFGSDNKLYISIGSSCDTCLEQDEMRATIYRMDKNGNNLEKMADGLRNSVFMTTDPVTGKLWATEMGRDNLGNNLPPDEINIIEKGNFYGWPYCYGDNIRDQKFQPTKGFDCQKQATGSHIDIPAHSAPLGLGFIPEEGWPDDYGLDLLVAYHGSWNRTPPTGYKITRFQLDEQRNLVSVNDFIRGWLSSNEEKFGRPVDIEAFPGGIVLITDDANGVVYKITLTSNQ